jgi:D-hexose-6-phosphate mutarotase
MASAQKRPRLAGPPPPPPSGGQLPLAPPESAQPQQPSETGSAEHLEALNSGHGVDGVTFVADPSGPSAKAVLTCAGAKAEVYLFGAHCVSWQAKGLERLWMSGLSKMDGSAPIRGGVPVAWPQFASAGPLPLHGFARTSLWHVRATHHGQPGTSLTLGLSDSARTRALWPHAFDLSLVVTLTPTAIAFELSALNTGSTPLSFTGCLHTYLRFRDSAALELHGLGGERFVDKCDGGRIHEQEAAGLALPAEAKLSGSWAGKKGYVDRIYLGTTRNGGRGETEVRGRGGGGGGGGEPFLRVHWVAVPKASRARRVNRRRRAARPHAVPPAAVRWVARHHRLQPLAGGQAGGRRRGPGLRRGHRYIS